MTDFLAVPGLVSLGWDDDWAAALDGLSDPDAMPARVSRVDRGLCTVMTATSEVRAGFERGTEVAVGDWVGVVANLATVGRVQIAAVLPRRSELRRQTGSGRATSQIVAANVDTVLLCDAVDGVLTSGHLERFLALAWQSGARPVVCLTKSDSVAPGVLAESASAVAAVAQGVAVVALSSMTGEGLDQLTPCLLEGMTVALLGLSGSGKSTLANVLSGNGALSTGTVRRDGTGRHTTTRREMVRVQAGGLLIDTPGIRALSVLGASEGVVDAFADVESLAAHCSYPQCSHTSEPGCELTLAVSEGSLEGRRLDSWLRLKAEAASDEPGAARREVAERKLRKDAKVSRRRAQAAQADISSGR
jgi:ribosome biogenesis GTPase